MCPAGHEAGMADPLQHSQANVPTFYAHVQLAAQHVLVESVGDLEGHEVWGGAGYVLSNPGLEDGVALVRVILFNQPLDRQACIDDNGTAHAHPAVSARLLHGEGKIWRRA